MPPRPEMPRSIHIRGYHPWHALWLAASNLYFNYLVMGIYSALRWTVSRSYPEKSKKFVSESWNKSTILDLWWPWRVDHQIPRTTYAPPAAALPFWDHAEIPRYSRFTAMERTVKVKLWRACRFYHLYFGPDRPFNPPFSISRSSSSWKSHQQRRL